MKKSLKDLAEELRVSSDTIRRYLCRSEFSNYTVSRGGVINYKPDLKLKLYKSLKTYSRGYKWLVSGLILLLNVII